MAGSQAGTGDEWSEGVLDLIPDGVVVLTDGPTVAWLNRTAAALLGVDRDTSVGRPCGDVLDIRDAAGNSVCALAPLGSRLPLVKGLPEREFELTRSDGTWLPVAMRCTYEKDDRDVVRRVVCTLRDIRARRGMDLRTVEVISTVSHEIRSPLTSIKGFTKTLLDRWDRFDDGLKREMLAAVNNDADRVTRLLTELLDISRLEAGRLRLRQRALEVPSLVANVIERVAPQDVSHAFECRFPEDFPPVVADPDKLQQVLTNLLENAVKYTEGGTITVAGAVEDGRVVVSVADEGEGIPPSQLPRLFRKFYRRERAGSPSGTGLGLYISKGLIEAHGGELTAVSVEGRGSTFTFKLPIQGAAHE